MTRYKPTTYSSVFSFAFVCQFFLAKLLVTIIVSFVLERVKILYGETFQRSEIQNETGKQLSYSDLCFWHLFNIFLRTEIEGCFNYHITTERIKACLAILSITLVSCVFAELPLGCKLFMMEEAFRVHGVT